MSGVQMVSVTADEAGQRLDRWFKRRFPGVGHGALEKMLRKGQIRVDGGRAKANRRLEEGEEVRVPPLEASQTVATKGPAPVSEADAKMIRGLVLYEDEALIALNKPFGLAVQGGAKTMRHVDGMLGAFGEGEARPRLVHRLDRDTGGLLLLAKTRAAAAALTTAFQGKDVLKTYWALVVGAPPHGAGTIDLPIAKRMVRMGEGETERVVPGGGDDAKKALTDYAVVDSAGPAQWLALRPITGRTHQLRVHCAAMGTPILGDGKYGGARAHLEGVSDRMHLFCREMTFPHPVKKTPVTLTAPLSGHMAETWAFFGFPTSTDDPFAARNASPER